MKCLAALLLAFSLSAQAAPSLEEVATSTDTFAVCKAADVITTAYVIEHGIGVETNPIVAPLIAHGYIPLILVSYGMYRLIKWINNPGATLAVNVVTCGAAINNLMLIP
jgi:hypothetical protein